MHSIEKIRANHAKLGPGHGVRQLYGYTALEWDQVKRNLRRRQDGKCAICLTALSFADRAVVDHDHTTLVIRGMLCTRCNNAIGCVLDSTEIAARLYWYLIAAEKTTAQQSMYDAMY